MRQAGGKAQQVEGQVAGRHRAGEVAGREHGHQRDQQCASAPAGGQYREHGRADDHAQRVGADDVAGLRDGDGNVFGDLWQQAHDDELAGADGKAADAEREHRAQELGGRDGRCNGGGFRAFAGGR
ncbi:hypothetical protein D9M69_512880 [compost metagenome]